MNKWVLWLIYKNGFHPRPLILIKNMVIAIMAIIYNIYYTYNICIMANLT